ncbi:glycoside hydrolase [Brachyspira pilosicoli]|uniref:sialidase family protein n=1 Tax=Brachyspira pilosicoli TaxID=52584 RepID=UPI002542923E|nr:sialidase family protein [Brachyspira pilosicoli]WIH86726.1 glycoside hydrolase [Brachyspira pilosicoli]
MSKKIIYLLSLLMALSLVFASCKKNGAGDISGPGPSDNGTDNSPTTDDGLAPDQGWLDSNSDKPIKNDLIPGFQSVGGQAYFRNPVIVVMGANGSDVVVFGEKRYKSLGADNDIGVDGNTAVDIVYISSQDSGKKWGAASIVGRQAGQEATAENAVASPVVFKVNDSTVVVVASGGVGLSRVSQTYDARGKESKLMYAVGTYVNGSFQWTKEWTEMTQKVKKAITEASGTFGTAKQFAVHSGKGVVNGTTLYLAVTVSDQGNSSTPKEEMGNIMFTGEFSNNDVTWNKVDSSAVKFSASGNFSQHKESRVIEAAGKTAAQIQYISVGNPYSSPANNNIGYSSQSGNQPQNRIAGSEGSPAYLVVKDWRGATSYNPADYNLATTGTEQKRLFAHVKSRNSTITMHALQDANFTQEGKDYTVIGYPQDTTALAKSSSMDVLGDGTIIMVAEQGGTEKVYNVVFKRFTQKFLATQLGIN